MSDRMKLKWGKMEFLKGDFDVWSWRCSDVWLEVFHTERTGHWSSNLSLGPLELCTSNSTLEGAQASLTSLYEKASDLRDELSRMLELGNE